MSKKSPPQPPQMKRKVSLYPRQVIGIPLMLLIPFLALFGVFGEATHVETSSNSELRVQVEYPSRFRYKMIGRLTVQISNISPHPLPLVKVKFDRNYVSSFSAVSFIPSVKSITESNYILEVNNLQPGETQVISASIQGEKYGMQSGDILVEPENARGVQVPVSTFTFP